MVVIVITELVQQKSITKLELMAADRGFKIASRFILARM